MLCKDILVAFIVSVLIRLSRELTGSPGSVRPRDEEPHLKQFELNLQVRGDCVASSGSLLRWSGMPLSHTVDGIGDLRGSYAIRNRRQSCSRDMDAVCASTVEAQGGPYELLARDTTSTRRSRRSWQMFPSMTLNIIWGTPTSPPTSSPSSSTGDILKL